MDDKIRRNSSLRLMPKPSEEYSSDGLTGAADVAADERDRVIEEQRFGPRPLEITDEQREKARLWEEEQAEAKRLREEEDAELMRRAETALAETARRPLFDSWVDKLHWLQGQQKTRTLTASEQADLTTLAAKLDFGTGTDG